MKNILTLIIILIFNSVVFGQCATCAATSKNSQQSDSLYAESLNNEQQIEVNQNAINEQLKSSILLSCILVLLTLTVLVFLFRKKIKHLVWIGALAVLIDTVVIFLVWGY